MKKYLLSVLAALLLTGCAKQDVVPEATVYVGTYTDGDARGIYSFRLALDSATSVPADTLAVLHPTHLVLSPGGSYLYAVSEEADTARAYVNAVKLDGAGRMSLLDGQKSAGASPVYADCNNTLIGVANYGSGTMSVFPVEADGSVAELAVQYVGSKGDGGGGAAREPHVSCVRFMPDGGSVVFSDVSADRLYIVHANRRNDSVSVRPGFAPQHIVFSASGKRAYVSSGTGDGVAVFTCDGYMLTQQQEVRTDTAATLSGGSMCLSPDGKFLYAVLRGTQDGIAVYGVDAKSGDLTRLAFQPAAREPRSVAVSPDGQFLLCACRGDNKVQIFRRDGAGGLLTDTHNDIRVPQPAVVVITE